MRIHIILLVLIILACFGIPIVSALSSYSDAKLKSGETSAKITWNGSVVTNVYVDGVLKTDTLGNNVTKATNYTTGYFILSKIYGNSEHIIRLQNASNPTDYKDITINTNPNLTIILVLFIVSVVLLAVSFIFAEELIIIIFCLLTIIFAFWGYVNGYNIYGIQWLFLAIVIAQAFRAFLNGYSMVKEQLNWF